MRLMAETGLRAGEVLAIQMADVDLHEGRVIVRRGKGGKGRTAPFGAQTAAAIDRYMRARRSHRLSDTTSLWLGGNGQTFSYHGLNLALKRRAAAAGIAGFHLHLMRHTAATRWLRAGGPEGGLMSVAGWSTRSMVDRYIGASAAERAATEARGLNSGDDQPIYCHRHRADPSRPNKPSHFQHPVRGRASGMVCGESGESEAT